MIALLICDVCDTQLNLSESEVVAAAEVATFAEAHSDHETCGFTVCVAGNAGTFTTQVEGPAAHGGRRRDWGRA